MNIKIDLSQETTDLVTMLVEIDRIEAIAAGETPARTDRGSDQAASKAAEN